VRRCLEAQRAIPAVLSDEVGHEVIDRVRQQVCRVGQLGEMATGPQDGDPIPQLDGLVDVVGNEDDGLAEIVLQSQELVLELFSHDGIHGAERLVHEHHRRVGRQCPGHTDALLLAAGELCGIALGEAGRQAHPLEQLKSPRLGPAPVPAEQHRDRGDVGNDGPVGKEAGVLDDIADSPTQLGLVHRRGVLVVDPDSATGWLDHPVDHPQ